MPKTTKTNPVLHLSISQELDDALKALAAGKKLSVAELSRRLLTQGVSLDAAHDEEQERMATKRDYYFPPCYVDDVKIAIERSRKMLSRLRRLLVMV